MIRHHSDTRDLATAVLRHHIPNRCLVYVEDTDSLPQDHPARGKQQVDGQPTLYICVGTRCSLPVDGCRRNRFA